jgi:anti-sigma factor RsiW
MNCAESRLLLHAYTNAELDLVRSLDVEQHLQTCHACATESRSLLSLRSALRTAEFTHHAPQSLRNKVRQIARTPDEKPRPIRAPWLWQWLAAGATALALLTLLLRPAGVSDHDLLANEIVSSHVRSLMPGHLTDVVSSDQHTVKPWFNGKLDFAPDVKDFAAQGFPLAGGRLDYLNGRAVAALVYHRNQHLINVFVWPVDRAGGAKATVENRRGYNLINREANGLHHVLVSDLNAGELGELADLIGK